MTFSTRDLNPRIATEIRSDKETLLSGKHSARMRELLEQRGVLVFPQINFDDDAQVAFNKSPGTFAPERAGETIYTVKLDPNAHSEADSTTGTLYWPIHSNIQNH